MKIKKDTSKIIKYITVGIGILIFVIGVISNYSNANLCAIYIFVIMGEILYFSKKNIFLILLFIFLLYFNYSIIFADYLHIIEGTIFTSFANTDVANKGIYILMIFWNTILAFLNTNISSLKLVNNPNFLVCDNKCYYNKIIIYGLYIVLLFIFIFGFTRPEISGERGSVTTIYEYSTIIFIICYYFGNKYKDCKVITSIILILFALQNFIYGGRATGVQLLLLLYIFIFSYKYDLKRVLPFGIIGIVLLTIIGGARGNIINGSFDIENILLKFKNNYFTSDTAFSSYHTSLTFILVRSMLSMEERLNFFGHLILSIFIGGKALGEYNLPIFTRKYYIHYYGRSIAILLLFLFWMDRSYYHSYICFSFYINVRQLKQ